MKKVHAIFRHDDPTFVVLHGMHRKSRGRKPSMPFRGERNPHKAFQAAKQELDASIVFLRPNRTCTTRDLLRASNLLGLRPLTIEELQQELPGFYWMNQIANNHPNDKPDH